MKKLTCCLLFLGLNLAAQPVQEDRPDAAAVARLNETLLTLGRTSAGQSLVSQHFGNDIMSLAEATHEPSRATVARFTDELANALIGRELPVKPLSQLTGSIVDVVRSSVTPTYKFRASVKNAQEALVSMGVSATKAQAIAERLTAIGKEVRGPTDLPLQKLN